MAILKEVGVDPGQPAIAEAHTLSKADRGSDAPQSRGEGMIAARESD